MSSMIHPTAIIDSSAKLAADIDIGPYTVIGPNVEIGAGTQIGSHVVIDGPCRIGKGNKIYQFAAIGGAPQDLKFSGEETFLEIGDYNTFREFCTVHRGTVQDQGKTVIGNHNLFMAYVHIAHDCVVANYTIFANNASLAGHVKVDDYAILSGFSGVFQFCRVGKHSFCATNSVVIKDVPPYVKVSGHYAKPYGLNTVGLKRRGFSQEAMTSLRRAYRIIYRQGLTLTKSLEALRELSVPEVACLVEFLDSSTAGIVR